MKWADITLQQFQFIDRVNNDQDYDDLDKMLHTACILFGHTEYTIAQLPTKKVEKLLAKTHKLFSKECPDIPKKRIGKYFINFKMDTIRFGQYVELTHFIQNGAIENADKILASVAHLPFRKNSSANHYKVSEYFLGQPVPYVIGSTKAVIESFAALNDQYKGLFSGGESVTDPFNKYYGWVFSATQVAEHERITLEQAFDLPIRQALNNLAYLKSKGEYDKSQIKRHAES
jgi:hypothetical protein